jgi:predicted  nucleic acid-binding Zn-ribbon protein
MNEQEMKYYTDMINKKDDEIYLLNVECEKLQEEIGSLKRKVEELDKENEQIVELSEELIRKVNKK